MEEVPASQIQRHDKAVAMGAAIQDGVLKGDVKVFSKNTTIPTSRKCSPQQPTTRRRWPSRYSKVCPRLRSHSKSTGKKLSITIRSSGGLSDTNVERMVQEAKVPVALRRFSWGAMAGDAFTSGVLRFGPPTERPLLP